MKTSQRGIELIQSFEDCKLKAYADPLTGGVPWSIGWGATGPGITQGTVWTQMQADQRFADDLAERERAVLRAVTKTMTQGQFDALVSIVYNVGYGSQWKDGILRLKDGRPSTLIRKFLAGDIPGAADQFLLWISPGSSVERGLLRRRKAERELFLS